MLEVISFIINAILYFLNSLSKINVPGINISLLSVFVSYAVLKLIFSFVLALFKHDYREQKQTFFKNRSMKKNLRKYQLTGSHIKGGKNYTGEIFNRW